MRFPAVLGSDGAGTVVAVGPDVRGFKAGDEVYGTANGFYAEYVKARADRIARVPKSINLTEASVLAISGLSALQGLDDVLQLKAGETLIVHWRRWRRRYACGPTGEAARCEGARDSIYR